MNTMKFYFTPGSCSTGIHILLTELDLMFAAYPVNLMKGEQHTPEFLAINPQATVPVLVLADKRALTDFISIAWWLGRAYPRAGLIPAALDREIAVLELLNYAVNTIHGEGFTRIFTTEKYTPNPDEISRVTRQGRDIVEHGLEHIAAKLAHVQLDAGGLSIADAAIFYVEFWSDRTGIALPQSCLRHYRRMLQRPAVRQVLMEEGYHATLAEHDKAEEEGGYAIARPV